MWLIFIFWPNWYWHLIFLLSVARSSSPSAYIQTQWETCETSGEQCLLNYLDSHDIEPTLPPQKCQLGSIPDYFVSLRFDYHFPSKLKQNIRLMSRTWTMSSLDWSSPRRHKFHLSSRTPELVSSIFTIGKHANYHPSSTITKAGAAHQAHWLSG